MASTLGNMLTSLRNAQKVGKKEVRVPASKLKAAVLDVLKDHKYIASYTTEVEGVKSTIVVTLKYTRLSATSDTPGIVGIDLVSRPGGRAYITRDTIPFVRDGFGIAIVSTSKGVMTGKDAYRAGVGGELLCKVW